MTNQFLFYEQALVLKELGFDEPCLGYWNIDPYLPKPTFNLVKPFEHEWCLPAPLYQQAIKFFREKYELYSFIFKFDEGFGYEMYKEGVTQTYDYCDTYEEAELECLKKLIEIVKTK